MPDIVLRPTAEADLTEIYHDIAERSGALTIFDPAFEFWDSSVASSSPIRSCRPAMSKSAAFSMAAETMKRSSQAGMIHKSEPDGAAATPYRAEPRRGKLRA